MKRSLVSTLSLAALCLTPLALTGCGGDDDNFIIGDNSVFAYVSVDNVGIRVFPANTDVGQFTGHQQEVPGYYGTLQKFQDDDRLFALRADGGDRLVTFQVSDDGGLTQVDEDPALPFARGQELVVHPSSRVYHPSGNQIEKFDITGDGFPTNNVITNTGATNLFGGATTSNGAFIYFGDAGTGAIWGFDVNGDTGALTNVQGADTPVFQTPGNSVGSLAFAGNFLIVVDNASDAVHSFGVAPAGGLQLISTVNLPAGGDYFDVESRNGVIYVSEASTTKQTQVLTISDAGGLAYVNPVNGGGAFVRLVEDFDVLGVADFAGALTAQEILGNGNLAVPTGSISTGGTISGFEIITTSSDNGL